MGRAIVAAAPAVLMLFIVVNIASISVMTSNADVRFSKLWSVTFKGPIYDLDIGRSGKRALVTVAFPASLELYDISGKPRRVWHYSFGKDLYLQAARLSPDGNRVTALLFWEEGSNYKSKVITISISDSTVLWETNVFNDPGWDVAYSPDGSLVIVSPQSNYVVALDARNGKVIWRTELPVSSTYGVAVTKDTVYVGAFIKKPYSGAVVALSIKNGDVLWISKGFDDVVLELLVSINGSLLFGGIGIDYGNNKYGGKVVALNTASGKKLWETKEFSDYVWGIAEIPHTGLILSGIESGTMTLISTNTGETVKTFPVGKGLKIDCLVMSPSKPMLLVALENKAGEGILIAYNVVAGTTSTSPTQATSTMANTGTPTKPQGYGVAWVSPKFSDLKRSVHLYFDVSPDGRLLAIMSNQSGTFYLVSLKTGRIVKVIKPPLSIIRKVGGTLTIVGCRWSPDGKVIYFSVSPLSSKPSLIFAYSLTEDKVIWYRVINMIVSRLELSPNGKYVAVAVEKPPAAMDPWEYGPVVLDAGTGSTIMNVTAYRLMQKGKLDEGEQIFIRRRYITTGFSFSSDSSVLYLWVVNVKKPYIRVIAITVSNEPKIVWRSEVISSETLSKYSSPDSITYPSGDIIPSEIQASPNGKYVAVSYSIKGKGESYGPYSGVALVSARTGEIVWSELIDTSVNPLDDEPFTRDGKFLVYVARIRGPQKFIKILDTESLKIIEKIELKDKCGDYLRYARPAPDEGVLAFFTDHGKYWAGWLVKFSPGKGNSLTCINGVGLLSEANETSSLTTAQPATQAGETSTTVTQPNAEGSPTPKTKTTTTEGTGSHSKSPALPVPILGVGIAIATLIILAVLGLTLLRRRAGALPPPPPPPP